MRSAFLGWTPFCWVASLLADFADGLEVVLSDSTVGRFVIGGSIWSVLLAPGTQGGEWFTGVPPGSVPSGQVGQSPGERPFSSSFPWTSLGI